MIIVIPVYNIWCVCYTHNNIIHFLYCNNYSFELTPMAEKIVSFPILILFMNINNKTAVLFFFKKIYENIIHIKIVTMLIFAKSYIVIDLIIYKMLIWRTNNNVQYDFLTYLYFISHNQITNVKKFDFRCTSYS